VVDGEIIIVNGDRLDFEGLLQRIHPAASRVTKLSTETPAIFVSFDLLATGDDSLLELPLSERRGRLEDAMADAGASVYLTPATQDVRWRASGSPRSRGPGSTAWWPSPSAGPTSRTSGRC
jgi:ATP-dependent DNA ligase